MKNECQFAGLAVAAFVLLSIEACTGIFVPDPVDPRLPKYTETGNQAAGAFVNGKVWRSVVGLGHTDLPYITSYGSGDSLLIVFEGSVNDQEVSLAFRLREPVISSFRDLVELEGQKIMLDGTTNEGVYMTRWLNTYGAGEGQIYFRYVDLDYSDSVTVASVSGTFGFTVHDTDSGKVEVTYGRFDYLFRPDQNFLLE